MKRKISTTNLIYLILPCILFLSPALVHAQPGFGDDVNDVPVDGGLSLLVAAGVGYGAKKSREQKERKILVIVSIDKNRFVLLYPSILNSHLYSFSF